MTTTLTAPITGDVTIKPHPKTRRLQQAEKRLAMARDGHASPETLAILQRRVIEAGAVAWLEARRVGETDRAVLAFIEESIAAVLVMLEGMAERRRVAVAA